MLSANEIVEVNQAQRTYARLAGILMLGAILVAIGGGAILSNIAGSGNFAETAARIAASEPLYRLALSSVLIVTFVPPQLELEKARSSVKMTERTYEEGTEAFHTRRKSSHLEAASCAQSTRLGAV